MVAIKILAPEDAPSYRHIRLEALQLHPEQFGSGYAQQVKLAKLYFESLIEAKSLTGKMIGAFVDEQLVGICGVTFNEGTAHVIQMYVKSAHQQKGLGGLLLSKVIEVCDQRSTSVVKLEVMQANLAAKQLYQKAGFVVSDSLDLGTLVMAREGVSLKRTSPKRTCIIGNAPK